MAGRKKAETKAAAVEKVVEVKPEEEKQVKKPAEKKPAEKKPAAKKTTVLKENIVLQFAGKELETNSIMKQVKTYWTKELKNKVGDMKTVTLYLKPEESKAYFVINGDTTGSVEL